MTAKYRLAQAQELISAAVGKTEDHYRAALGALEAHQERLAAAEAELAKRITQEIANQPVAIYGTWDLPGWQSWTPMWGLPEELRIATLQGALAGLPATVPLFTGHAILFCTEDENAARHVRAAFRALAVRAAAAMGPGLALHLLDPLQEGNGYPERQHLANAQPRTTDVAKDIKSAFETAQADTSKLRHVVLAMDYPQGYDHAAVGYLNRLPRLANTQLVLHHALDARATLTSQLDLDRPVVVDVNTDGTAAGPWGRYQAQLDQVPHPRITRQVGAALTSGSQPSQASWGDLNPGIGEWSLNARRAATAIIGLTSTGEPIEMIFGRDQDNQMLSHMVVAGATGSGKSVLLHNLICALAAKYAPDEVQFILVDGRDGAEMSAYRSLPHAQAVAVHTPRELAESIILDVQAELLRRNGILVAHRVQGIEQLPNAAEGGLARLVVVVDEYQVYLGGHRGEVERALLDIAARGRAVGIHLVLASQRFNASGMTNPRALFANVHTFVAMRMSIGEVAAITEFDAAGRKLISSHCVDAGSVVVSRNQGAGPHLAGKASWLSGQQVSQIVASLADQDPRSPLVLDGTASPDASDNPAMRALSKLPISEPVEEWASCAPADGGLGVGWWPAGAAAFIVGRTFTLWGSAFAQLTRSAKQNVAVVAERPEVMVGVLLSGLTSWSQTATPSGLQVWVLAQPPARPVDPWHGALANHLAGLLQAVGHGHRQAANQAQAVAMLDEALTLAQQRAELSAEELANAETVVLVAAGLEYLPEFQMVEGRYGAEPAEAMVRLLRLANQGPLLGIHVVLAASSPAAWRQLANNKDLNLFRHRFYGQLPALDSHKLLGNQHANQVDGEDILAGPPRLGYTDANSDELVRLLPYVCGEDLVNSLQSWVRRP